MPSSFATLRATKAAGYFDSLCRHFARKVAVEREGNRARVQFPMGGCLMSLDGQQLQFRCDAEDELALNAMQTVISQHALRFGEWRNADVCWTAT
ncbi:MAG: DUF2218 domain-containing protein [Gammaproteobacteria bacterium]|jgi:hypothetical protein|nr:DUF2218 domain-containing protein [Gammaproteobacteria bacterium]